VSRKLSTECYLVLEPTYTNGRLSGFKVAKVAQRAPKKATTMLKLGITVPEEVFTPFVVTAEINTTKKDIQVGVESKSLTRGKIEGLQ
jgi:hypothetical protein